VLIPDRTMLPTFKAAQKGAAMQTADGMKNRFFRTQRLGSSSVDSIRPFATPSSWLCGNSFFAILTLTLLLPAKISYGQDTANLSWLARATQTRSRQPDWVTPLITASANLEEAVIYDTSRKLQTNGSSLWTLGGPRGVQFAPFGKLQITYGATPYEVRVNSKSHDGFGDTSFAFKYRFASGNAENGNFAFSGLINTSIPTGSYQNGQQSAILSPVLLGEKGWGNFNIQTTFGAALPLAHSVSIGRQYSWSTAFQYHIGRFFDPELETNMLAYQGGTNHGQKQLYLLPGVIVGRFPVTRSAALTFGVGMQIATAHDRAFNHNLIFSVRVPLQSHGGRRSRFPE
jgi:hypothetical protein